MDLVNYNQVDFQGGGYEITGQVDLKVARHEITCRSTWKAPDTTLQVGRLGRRLIHHYKQVDLEGAWYITDRSTWKAPPRHYRQVDLKERRRIWTSSQLLVRTLQLHRLWRRNCRQFDLKGAGTGQEFSSLTETKEARSCFLFVLFCAAVVFIFSLNFFISLTDPSPMCVPVLVCNCLHQNTDRH